MRTREDRIRELQARQMGQGQEPVAGGGMPAGFPGAGAGAPQPMPGGVLQVMPQEYQFDRELDRTAGQLQQQAEQVIQRGGMRSPEEDAAYRMGQRMGAESMLQDGGIQLKGAPGSSGMLERMSAGQVITKDELRKADERLMKYKSGKASVDRRIIHAQQWWKMRNWQEISREKGIQGATMKKSATAWLWNCIVGKHADAIDSYPEPVILPRMQDDQDEAKKLGEIVPVVLQMNGFEDTYSMAQWQKMQEGTAGYGVFWDKNKVNGMGDISVKKINILNLFWEPGITDIQDSQHLFYISFVDNDQLTAMYPQLKGKLKNTALSIEKYRTDDSVDMTNKSAVIDWYYHKWQGTKKVLHYVKYVGEEILFSTENNGEANGLYDDGNYPYVLDPLFPVEGSPCGYGYIDIGKDAQADIDTLNQAMVLNAAANATPRYFVRKDGGINEDEFCDWSKPIIHASATLGQDSIMPMQAATMGGTAITMLQQKIDELKFVTGNSDVNNGGTPAGVTAASAIAALKEDAGRSSKDSTKAAYRAYAKIVTMVIERIRQFYDIPRQFRILGEYGQEQFTQYSNAGIRPQTIPGGLGLEDGYRLPVFDIEVRAQRENAYTKMSQNELALQFYNSGMFNPQMSDQVLCCLDMMEFKGKDQVLQKVQKNGTMQETLMQVGQIALQLAAKYQPDVAEQLAGVLQGVAGDQMAAMQQIGKGINPAASAAVRESDPMKGGMEAQENGIVRRAREQAANASRPS